MNVRTLQVARIVRNCVGILVTLILVGCSTTSSTRWDQRIGAYSWDDALLELGPPDRVADLEGGIKAAEWITVRNPHRIMDSPPPSYTRGEVITSSQTYGWNAPDKILRLMFTPDGKLIDWNRNY